MIYYLYVFKQAFSDKEKNVKREEPLRTIFTMFKQPLQFYVLLLQHQSQRSWVVMESVILCQDSQAHLCEILLMSDIWYLYKSSRCEYGPQYKTHWNDSDCSILQKRYGNLDTYGWHKEFSSFYKIVFLALCRQYIVRGKKRPLFKSKIKFWKRNCDT